MMSFLKRLRRSERGNVLIVTALAMPLLIGSAGLATDTIQWALWKRQLQKAADSAAIAGVYARMAGQNVPAAVNYDLGPNTTPGNNRTGYTLLGAPVIGYPSNTADWNNAVSVQLQMQNRLPFSSMFMSAAPIITASATAAGVETGIYCVVSLENANVTGITAGGNTSVNFGCGMITNSTSMDAAVAFGSSSVRATPVAAVGGLDSTDNWASGTTLLPFTVAQQDPFRDVQMPSVPSTCNERLDDQPSRVTDFTVGGTQMGPVTKCLNRVDVKGDMTLQPGTYIVTGDFKVNASARLSCNGCTFILTSPTGTTPQIDLNGGATLDLRAPTTGDYAGLLFFQDRNATNVSGNKINGNASSVLEGAFYFPGQEVEYTGNASVTFGCVKIVARRVRFMGNSRLTDNCPAGYPGQDNFRGRHVRLVA